MFGKWPWSHIIFKRLAKALIRLHISAGWIEPLLVAHTTLLEISCCDSIILMKNCKLYLNCFPASYFFKPRFFIHSMLYIHPRPDMNLLNVKYLCVFTGLKICGGCSLDGEELYGVFVKRVLPGGLADQEGKINSHFITKFIF